MADKLLKKIIRGISDSPRVLRTRELARKMGIKPSEYRNFRRVIRDAITEGKIVKARGGKLAIPSKGDLHTGRLVISRAGPGFVITSDGKADIFISQRDLGGAIHGEQVEVVLKPNSAGKSREGKIVRVIDREKGRVVGKIKPGRFGMFVHPDDPRLPDRIEIDNPGKLPVQRDMIASVRLYPYEAPYIPPRGKVEELLGMAGSPGVDIDSLIISHGLPREFDNRIKPELALIRKTIAKTALRGRVDLRDKIVFTIDPADAKDHDDAISIERIDDDRFQLGVHIADVSHYVKSDSALDSEAMLRGNSVYLVDRVIPMLPEKLSADICSLHHDEDRLTLSFLAEIDKTGKVYQWRFAESVIKSRASLNYEEVQEYLDGKPGTRISREIGDSLKNAAIVARNLREKRLKKGGLDFDLPEPKILLDPYGKVLDIFTPQRLESHQIIEDLMLLTNKYAALLLEGAGIPILFRVHAKPDNEKIKNFLEILKEMGYDFSFKGEITPIKLQRIIKTVKGKPEEQFIEEILLRSLPKAAYQPENIGHFGLAFPNYTHFTSPIRRYPDLLVHRTLKNKLSGKLGPVMISELTASLKRIGMHCTETEIAAEQAERESLKIKMLEYLRERVGGVFDGIISGVVKSGFFVELRGSMVEGFVTFSSLEDDYFTLDEGKYRAVGKRSNRVFRLGDTVRVIVARVDMEEKRADFVLVESNSDSSPRGKKRRKRRK